MNDRQLHQRGGRHDGKDCGVPREDGFDITVASEIMAIFCLSTSITDLKERLARIVVGYTRDDKPVTAGDLKAQGAMAALLKDALKPNLVQTLEGTPAFVHGGHFANIAHGCDSIMATRMAMALGDYCVTEAGFGADLGAEKFLDIKCRLAGFNPDAVVVVATVRALKNHGGVAKADLNDENLEALEAGLPNLLQHVENITKVYQLPCVVAINRFPTDTEAELKLVEDKCRELGVNVALSECGRRAAAGRPGAADEVVRLCEKPNDFQFAYGDDLSLAEAIATLRVYHADGGLRAEGHGQLKNSRPWASAACRVMHGETQYSFSGRSEEAGGRAAALPHHPVRNARDVGRSVVALTGDIADHAGAREGARRRAHRRRRNRQDLRPVLSLERPRFRLKSGALLSYTTPTGCAQDVSLGGYTIPFGRRRLMWEPGFTPGLCYLSFSLVPSLRIRARSASVSR